MTDEEMDKLTRPAPITLTMEQRMVLREQVRAEAALLNPEPHPPVIRLVQDRDPDGRKIDQPPRAPVVDANGPIPRLIHSNGRAPAGLKRFKLRATNYGEQPYLYFLARNRDEAEACYGDVTRLTQAIATVTAMNPGTPAEAIRFACTELPD